MAILKTLAILDDYQKVSLSSADWTEVQKKVKITVFDKYIGNSSELVDTLKKFDIICCMRERTPFPESLLKQLPNLKLLITSGAKNASIDIQAAEKQGVVFRGTQSPGYAASELAWGLLLSLARNIHIENASMRAGGWQTTIGTDLKGQTLGIVGLGRHGSNVARFGHAFGMKVIAWSQNLSQQHCDAHEVEYVDKQQFFEQSDFISVHLKMGQRNTNVIAEQELQWMKPSAYLINTSRGPIVNEKALIKSLKNKKIAGVALDVYDQEPLPKGHAFLNLPNVLMTSHIGFVTKQTYQVFYGGMVENVLDWLQQNE